MDHCYEEGADGCSACRIQQPTAMNTYTHIDNAGEREKRAMHYRNLQRVPNFTSDGAMYTFAQTGQTYYMPIIRSAGAFIG